MRLLFIIIVAIFCYKEAYCKEILEDILQDINSEEVKNKANKNETKEEPKEKSDSKVNDSENFTNDLRLNLRNLSIHNNFNEEEGCYIACHKQSSYSNSYKYSNNDYVVGCIRVQGSYVMHICRPMNYENNDISTLNVFQDMCEQEFPNACKNKSCWAVGDTGT